jgi:pimeloyl-ACP methyl ester carboxylesterase
VANTRLAACLRFWYRPCTVQVGNLCGSGAGTGTAQIEGKDGHSTEGLPAVINGETDVDRPFLTARVRSGITHGWRMARGLLEPLTTVAGLCIVPLLTGCGSVDRIESAERIEQGYVIVLPGIEGKSYLNTSVAKGLEDGGVPYLIEVYDWTAGSVLLFPITLCDLERNRDEARKVAAKIVEYENAHPGQPVHIIGHSGGGGLAVLVLEALPPDRQVTSAILLAPAIAPDYDLRVALRRTRVGIWNYYSAYDVGFLGAGTWIMGTIDGKHTAAAGQKGFAIPLWLDREGGQLYSRLYQVAYSSKMAETGHLGNHTGWANRRFVAEYLASLINSQRPIPPHYANDKPQGRPPVVSP